MIFNIALIIVGIVWLLSMIISIEPKSIEDYDRINLTPVIFPIVLLIFFYCSNMKEFNTYVVTDLVNDIGKFIIYGIIYLFVGLVWSFFKWGIYVKKKHKYYIHQIEESKKQNRNMLFDWKHYRPEVSKHKYILSMWIIWWIFSLIRYFLGDFIVNIATWLANQFGGIYNKITDRIFKIPVVTSEADKEIK